MSKATFNSRDLNLNVKKVLDLPLACHHDGDPFLACCTMPGETNLCIDEEIVAILDANGEPVDLFRGVESAALVRELAMPGLRVDAKFLATYANSIRADPTGSKALIRLRLGGDIERGDYFLITQKHHGALPNDYTPKWCMLAPELTVDDGSILSDGVKSRWVIWYTVAGSGSEGVDVWLVPVGYFNAQKEANGRFRECYPTLMTIDGGLKIEHFGSGTVNDAYQMFSKAADAMCWLYHQAFIDLERKYQEVAEEKLTQQLEEIDKREQLQQVCDRLNGRLNVVSQHKMSYIGQRVKFIVNSNDYIELNSSRPHSFYLDGAEQYMHKLELELEAYDMFQPKFEALRERIETAGGTLMTADSVYKATVRFPRETPDPKDGGVYEERPFPFAWVGVSNLKTWLKEVEDRTTKAIANAATNKEE